MVRSSVIPQIALDASLIQGLEHLWFQVKTITDDGSVPWKIQSTRGIGKSGYDLNYTIAFAVATLSESHIAYPSIFKNVLATLDRKIYGFLTKYLRVAISSPFLPVHYRKKSCICICQCTN